MDGHTHCHRWRSDRPCMLYSHLPTSTCLLRSLDCVPNNHNNSMKHQIRLWNHFYWMIFSPGVSPRAICIDQKYFPENQKWITVPTTVLSPLNTVTSCLRNSYAPNNFLWFLSFSVSNAVEQEPFDDGTWLDQWRIQWRLFNPQMFLTVVICLSIGHALTWTINNRIGLSGCTGGLIHALITFWDFQKELRGRLGQQKVGEVQLTALSWYQLFSHWRGESVSLDSFIRKEVLSSTSAPIFSLPLSRFGKKVMLVLTKCLSQRVFIIVFLHFIVFFFHR